MTFKAIFSLFLLVSTLAIIYAKPSPAQLYLDQASDDTTEDTNEDTLSIESDKQVANSQTKESLTILHVEIDCPWPPALCGHGGDFGEPT